MQTEMSQATSRSIATGQISRAKRTRERVKKRQEGNEERRADMGDKGRRCNFLRNEANEVSRNWFEGMAFIYVYIAVKPHLSK